VTEVDTRFQHFAHQRHNFLQGLISCAAPASASGWHPGWCCARFPAYAGWLNFNRADRSLPQ